MFTVLSPEESTRLATLARAKLPKKEPGSAATITAEAVSSGIGDCIKTEFSKHWVAASGGCGCEKVRKKLNAMSFEAAREEREAIVDQVLENIDHLDGASGRLVQLVQKVAPAFTRKKVAKIIDQCLAQSASAPEFEPSTDTVDRHESQSDIASGTP